MKTDDKKITNENPVSLSPLNFTEAMKGLLQVKGQPPKPTEKPKAKRKRKTSNKKAQ